MALIIGLLTFLLVLDCVFLVLLVLIQLPKKEAGVGVAFGGAATDALFGAGSGNVLTKATKYSAASFFVLALVLSILQSHYYHSTSAEFRKALEQESQQTQPVPPASKPSAPLPQATEPSAASTGLNLLLPTIPATNTPPPAPQK
jgi:preprotein translocase subunit SecG